MLPSGSSRPVHPTCNAVVLVGSFWVAVLKARERERVGRGGHEFIEAVLGPAIGNRGP